MVVVPVFVRKGADNDERRISFRIQPDMNALDLLDRGLAIDGNEAAFTIRATYETNALQSNGTGEWTFSGPFYDEASIMASSFTEALAIAQKGLVDYLRGAGYEPEFR